MTSETGSGDAVVEKSPLAERIRRWRPLPHEVAAIVYIVAGILLLENLPVTYPRTALFLTDTLPLAVITGAAGAIASLRWKLRGSGNRADLATEWISVLRIGGMLMFAMPIHFLLKSFIFLINRRTWDLDLWHLDQTLHLGYSPSRFFTALFPSVVFLRTIDVVYTGLYFFIVVAYTCALVAFLPLRKRFSFAAAYLYVWIAGSILYIAFPSWGPVYVFPEEFRSTLVHMPQTVFVQRILFEEISSIVRHPLAPRLVRFGSVAAFPSLHVAVVTLFTLTSRSVSRRWFQANLVLLLLIGIGTVVSGYHYLVDGYAGLLIGWGAWKLGELSFAKIAPEPAAAVPRLQ